MAAKKKRPYSSVVVHREVVRPLGVTLISIFFWVIAGFSLLVALALFAGGLAGTAIESFRQTVGGQLGLTQMDLFLLVLISRFALIGSLFAFVSALIHFFIGKALWHGKKWARTCVIILAGVFFVIGLLSLDFFSLILYGVIGGYLLFNKKALRFFSVKKK